MPGFSKIGPSETEWRALENQKDKRLHYGVRDAHNRIVKFLAQCSRKGFTLIAPGVRVYVCVVVAHIIHSHWLTLSCLSDSSCVDQPACSSYTLDRCSEQWLQQYCQKKCGICGGNACLHCIYCISPRVTLHILHACVTTCDNRRTNQRWG